MSRNNSGRTRSSININNDAINEDILDNSLLLNENEGQAARVLIDGKISKSTKANYSGCIRKLRDWFQRVGYNHLINTAQFATVEQCLLLPFDYQSVINFFGHLTARPEGISAEGLNMHRCALSWYLSHHNSSLDTKLYSDLSSLIKGFKKKIALKKKNGELPSIEGRHPITFGGYKLLALKFLSLKPEVKQGNNSRNSNCGSWNESIFSWPFWLLLWNLMQRSETIANVQLEHISWKEDSLTIVIPQSKTDQEGENIYHRHIFANPLQPEICPILALATLIFSKNYIQVAREIEERTNNNLVSWPLFMGSNQKHRMGKIIKGILDKMKDQNDLLILGSDPEYIGLHSPRKGSNTYCNGFIGGPSYPSICLRGGWKIGGVQDRYLFNQEGSDQFVGRTVAGLPFLSSEFAVLPPHFSIETLNSITDEEWRTILPLYKEYPKGFRLVLPYLMASLIHHEDFLRSNLPKDHSLFYSPLFSSCNSLFKRLKANVLTGILKCPITNLESKGVPPFITITALLKNVQFEVKSNNNDMINKLPNLLSSNLLSNFTIEGAIPITQDHLEKEFKKLIEKVETKCASVNTNNNSNIPNNAILIDNEVTSYKTFHWKGKFHPIPQQFKMPKVDCKTLWRLYHYGLENENIAPFRAFHKWDFDDLKEAMKFFKGKKVILTLLQIVKDNKLLPESKPTIKDCLPERDFMNNLFDQSFNFLLERLFGLNHASRAGELAYGTLSNRIADLEKRQRAI